LFVAPDKGADGARYCSDRCALRSSSSRRRARLRSAKVERYSRHGIFERDGWRCHICQRKTRKAEVVPHPLAPTIDHLIPLARGGSDTPANVATAHFICNSIKGDGAGGRGDQLAIM
jgi:5-methylcytosine-specific restriction endonuclease McrA